MKRTTTFVCPFIILIWMLTVFACTPRQQSAVMERADSLMNTRPDSALTLLNTLLPDTNAMSKRDLMRFHLLRTNAQNKCDTVFRAEHATFMRRVCDYYDTPPLWGNKRRVSNDRMLAHYLLGRCYTDMGEAPAALQEFHNAADAADTTSIDCNYKTLSLIHSQCGSIYSSLYMLRQDLNELKKAAHYAQLCHDTLSYLTYEDLMANAYGNLGMPDSLISVKQRLAYRFRQMGHDNLAAISIGACAYAYIQMEMPEEAKRCIDVYERESGMFLTNGDIRPNHEIYYFTKGTYYMIINQLDSSELFFRKILATSRNGNERIGAMQGLSELYKKRHNNDSVAKYSTLCYQLNDSVYKESEVANMMRLKASFDYSRLQKSEAKKQEQLIKEQQKKRRLILLVVLVVIVSGLVIWKMWSSRRKRLVEMSRELLQYAQDKQELLEKKKEWETLYMAFNKLESESSLLKSQSETLQKDKELTSQENRQLKQRYEEISRQVNSLQDIIGWNEQVIENLSKKIKVYESENPAFIAKESSLNSLASSDAFVPFSDYLRTRKVIPDNDCWNSLFKKIKEEMPGVKSFLLDRHGLTTEEYKICVLVLLNCSPSDISSILDKSLSFVSKRRKKLLRKVFNKEGKPEEFDQTLRILF